MVLKQRQADPNWKPGDMRADLLKAEAIHFAKVNGTPLPPEYADGEKFLTGPKRKIDAVTGEEEDEEEDWETKKMRVLVETRHLDADSSSSEDESSEDEVEEEDETTLLMRELEKIKQERAEKKAKEEAEKAAEEQEEREYDIAKGNPLLNPKDFNVKKRWDHDVVFKNQARGTEEKKGKEFVNDLLRSDFHIKFMVKCLYEGIDVS